MKTSLATLYRPTKFSDICSQKSIIKILERQIETKSFAHAILFAGPSGCGKTTIARIFANQINNGKGNPIEIDGASHNGVDNVKMITQSAKERSIDSEYKVYIVDECHMITIQGWNAFLKCIEEPPQYTIFIFCTTDLQKVPQTIRNRCQLYHLTKVDTDEIINRLRYICEQEHFTNYEESIKFIARLSEGGCRQAISNLEKVAGYSNDITIENTLKVLGDFSYDSFFTLTNAISGGDEATIIKTIDGYYNKGVDLKLFVDRYLDFVLDLTKYIIFKDINVTKIPQTFENVPNSEKCVKYAINIENNKIYFCKLVDKILAIKNIIRYDSSMKNTIEVMLLSASRGQM